MNNKSTENLIVSDGSIEELFAPTLKLDKSKNSSASDQTVDNEQKHVTNLVLNAADLHATNDGKIESLKPIAPVPAARRSILPPIPVKRTDKQAKNDQNQLRKKRSDESVEVVNERKKCFEAEKPSSSNSESDSEIRDNSARSLNKSNKIALTSLTKNHIKKQFVESRVNEETTSFISHEEKHEKEDVSEHLSSESSIEQLKQASTERLLEIEPPLKKALPRSEVPKTPKVKKSKKKKERKVKSAKKSRPSKRTEEPKDDDRESYDFKNVIGIWLHETTALKFDPLIRLPRVRVSIYDLNTGNLLMKSNPLRNAVLNYEPTNVTFIQPILSDHCRFKDTSWIECDWENELLIINEDIHHIEKEPIIIFFEILDILSDFQNEKQIDSNGWYSIAWAFLRPGNGKTYSNLNKKCSLQLHYYQRHRTKCNVHDEWKAAKRFKYPASLSVTVGSYKPELTQSISMRRPMSVLQEEITGDIYTHSDDEESTQINEKETEVNDKSANQMPSNRIELTALNLETRLPGQQCACPNRLMYRHGISGTVRNHSSQEQYGSMIAKFSPDGSLIAFHCTSYRRHSHEILVLNVNQSQITHKLIGHLNIVYDLDWLNENIFISVSSDRTAIVWFLFENKFSLKILPHPSFVYTVKCLPTPNDYVYIATGGRDSILRIWKMSIENIDDDIELCSELIQHEDYLTCLTANRKSSKLYSADWAGVLLEWNRSKSKQKMAQSFQLRRRMKVFPSSILRIELHLKNNRIYIQCLNDPLIYVIEITSAMVMQTIESPLEKRNTFTTSPCGTFIFTNGINNEQIKCIRISNTIESTYCRLPIPLTTKLYSITSICCHPTKDLFACTLFGNSISFCLYLMHHDNGLAHNRSVHGESLERDIRNLERWNGIRLNDNASNTFDAILHRIDDLFSIAIQSPKHFSEYEQLKQMQIDLEKLQQPLDNLKLNEKKDDTAAVSNDGQVKIMETKVIKTMEYDSSSSQHTFTLEKNPLAPMDSQKKDDENDKSSQTYSIKSDQSNLTFEIHK